MRENKIRTIRKAGGAVLNGWLAIPTAFSAETMAHQGWDSLTIDLQHGVVDYQAAINMLTAISTTGTVPVVRVPWLEPGIYRVRSVARSVAVAINLERREWSDVRCGSPPANPASASLARFREGRQELWILFATAALALLAIHWFFFGIGARRR